MEEAVLYCTIVTSREGASSAIRSVAAQPIAQYRAVNRHLALANSLLCQSRPSATIFDRQFTIRQETAMIYFAIAPVSTYSPVSTHSARFTPLLREVEFDAFPTDRTDRSVH